MCKLRFYCLLSPESDRCLCANIVCLLAACRAICRFVHLRYVIWCQLVFLRPTQSGSVQRKTRITIPFRLRRDC